MNIYRDPVFVFSFFENCQLSHHPHPIPKQVWSRYFPGCMCSHRFDRRDFIWSVHLVRVWMCLCVFWRKQWEMSMSTQSSGLNETTLGYTSRTCSWSIIVCFSGPKLLSTNHSRTLKAIWGKERSLLIQEHVVLASTTTTNSLLH